MTVRDLPGSVNPVTRAILETIRAAFDALGELSKTAPSDVDMIVAAMVAHLRSWRPDVSPLGTLSAPSDQRTP